jgi:hypothetical protein
MSTMINYNKLILFIVATALFIFALTLPDTDHIILFVMYVGFVIIGLYDIGKDEVDEAENKS